MNGKKFEALIFLIAGKVKEVPKVKLAKLLYYADFTHYKKYGKSITGAEYVHMEFGPCPDNFEKHIKKLVKSNTLNVDMKEYRGKCNHETKEYYVYSANAGINADTFSKDELKTIRSVLKEFGDLSGAELSARSHKEIPWKATKPFDKISYSLIRYENMSRDPEPEDEFFVKSPLFRKFIEEFEKKHKAGEIKLTRVR